MHANAGFILAGPGVIVRLSLGLAILYALVVIVWYELVRGIVLDRVRRRRGLHGEPGGAHAWNSELAPPGPAASENGGTAAAQSAPNELEVDRARRHFHLARQAAKAERDAAIEAASDAAGAAIERIERRYREIDAAFIDEENERISEVLGRTVGGNGERPGDAERSGRG